jgi:outer membrane protein TolC
MVAIASEPCVAPHRNVLLTPFLERVEHVPDAPPGPGSEDLAIPGGFVPWWDPPLGQTLLTSPQAMPVDLEGLMLSSLSHSARVRFLCEARQIAQTQVCEAQGAFDWRTFAESKFQGLSEPVGNLLTTGGADRYRDRNWYYSGGFRRQAYSGAQVEVSQRLGFENSNSIYFYPQDQGTSCLAISLTQPLLRGAGAAYNTRLIVLAEIETATSDREFLRNAQAHLIEVNRAYWQLYLARSMLLQKRRLSEQAEQIHAELVRRQQIDAVDSQILQAKAAVAKRRAEIVRAEMSVRNMESRIRAMVNDPALSALPGPELLPSCPASPQWVDVRMRESIRVALLNRPEIEQALCQVSASRVKLNVSENDLLPVLDMIMETYAKGLRGDSDIGGALGYQFSQGEPTYTLGLAFEVPLGNQTAKARNRRQQIELRKTICQYTETVETIWAEVEIAVREVQTAWQETAGQYHAMIAKQAELRSLDARWRLLAGDGAVASVLLEQLLENQEALAATEFAFANSLVGYNAALTQLKQADGTLLQIQPVCGPTFCRGGCPPMLLQERPDRDPVPTAPPLLEANRVIRLPAEGSAGVVRLPVEQANRPTRLPAVR